MVLPAWLASMVQVPEAMNVAVVPETVQTLVVIEVNPTARPDVAVAKSVSGVPTVCVPGLEKAMVCVVCVTATADEVPVALLYIDELLVSGE